MKAMIPQELVEAHRNRALTPDHPVLRGTAQNPDVYFQARETVNPYYIALPEIVQHAMDRFASLTGRQYKIALAYDLRQVRSCTDYGDRLVRLNIGLESTADLIADLERGLQAMQR
jgi:Pyruvate flavodoxin/ferredoxin oxidoreductase, thiamine diP-bdg/Cys/Met metabolism PLP-dependent enzyme